MLGVTVLSPGNPAQTGIPQMFTPIGPGLGVCTPTLLMMAPVETAGSLGTVQTPSSHPGFAPMYGGLPAGANNPAALTSVPGHAPIFSGSPYGPVAGGSWSPNLSAQTFPLPPATVPVATAHAGRVPLINVWEDESCFRIEADVPGVILDDLELQVAGRTLFIRTGRVIERAETKGQPLCCERACFPFTRAIPLTAEIDVDKVDAKLVNGVLELTLHKLAGQQRRTIRVNQVTA